MSAQPTHDLGEVRLFDEHDIARMFNLPGGKTYVLEKCREQEWPHLKFSARVIRFGPEEVAAIKELVRVTPKTPTHSPSPAEAPTADVARPMFNRAPKRPSRKVGLR